MGGSPTSSWVTRFAPSPTGYLHLGNARTALLSWLAARASGGRFVLRIEDTDVERSRDAYVRAVLEDLAWLGLDWDEGPLPGGGERGPHGPYRQSARAAQYAELFAQLVERDAAYPCFCTPEELERSRRAQRLAGRPPRYAGTCARLSAAERAERLAQGRPASLRFRVNPEDDASFDDVIRGPQRFAAADIGDFVIRRSDGSAAFFFANAVDDADQGVTLVLRGEDHLANTPRQRLILSALGKRVPAAGHLPLLLGDDGAPLSKRNGSVALRDLRAQGYLPEAVVAHLARLGHRYESDGWLDRDALIAGFSLDRIGRSPARHDPAQLRHWQAEAVRRASVERLCEAWSSHATLASVAPEHRWSVVATLHDNVTLPDDLGAYPALLNADWSPDGDVLDTIRRLLGGDVVSFAATVAAALARAMRSGRFADPDRAADDWAVLLDASKAGSGLKGKRLFMPLRLLLTGQAHGPELPRVVQHLVRIGGTACVQRRLTALV